MTSPVDEPRAASSHLFQLSPSLPLLISQVVDMSNAHIAFTTDHELDPISPDAAAEIIIAALEDPASVPLACPELIISCYDVLLHLWERRDPSWERRMLRRYRPVLRRSMEFVCVFRTAEQFRVLKKTFKPNRCRCRQGPRVLNDHIPIAHHGSLIPHGLGTLAKFLTRLDLLLAGTIAAQGGLSRLHKAKQRSAWPASFEELLPYGIASVYNLTLWIPELNADTAAQAEHVGLTCNVFDVMPSFMRPGFMKSPILVDWLHGTASKWLTQPVVLSARELSREINMTGAVLESTSYLSINEIIFWFSSSTQHSVQDVCTVLDRVLQATLTYPDASAAYPQIMGLRKPYVTIIDHLASTPDLDLRFEQIISEPAAAEVLRARRTDPIDRLGRAVYASNWNERCFGPGCIATRAHPGIRMKKCGGCRGAIYCSPGCQVAAWQHPEISHREICVLCRACGSQVEDGLDVPAAAKQAWGSLSREQLDSAYTNIQKLRESQLMRLSTCSRLPTFSLII
jgi:hypothetical protein